MSAFLAPIFGAGYQAFNNTGGVLAGGKLYTYIAGSSNPQSTWTDSTQAVANANPIVLNSAGRPASEIWLQGGVTYKFILQDSAGATIGTWDNIAGLNDATYSSLSEWISFGSAPTFVSATSFTVSGNQTSTLAVNRRVQCSLNSGTVYATISASSYNGGTGLTTVTITPDSGGLDSTLSSLSYGFLNPTNTSMPSGIFAPYGSQLPSQTGNSGLYVTTNGSSASWGRITAVYQAIAASLTLPDITKFSNFSVMAPTNAATVPSTLTTFDGWSVTTGFSAGTLSALAPTSYATQHGTWAGKSMSPPTLGTITCSGTSTIYGTAQIDTDLVVVLYRDGSNNKVVAIKPSTGAITASPQTVSVNNTSAICNSIFQITTTTFVAFSQSTSNNYIVICGTINTSDLSITMGTPQSGLVAPNQVPAQLTSTLYLISQNSAGADIRAISISGTTVTLGTAVDSGASSTSQGGSMVVRSDASTGLVVYLANGGGTASTRNLSARVASVSGTTVTLNTASSAATNIEQGTGIVVAKAFTEGLSYLAICQNGSVGTSGDFYGISVSGTTATVGAVTTRATDLPALHNRGTFVYEPKLAVKKYDNSTILLGHLSAGPYAVTISGTTLAFGSSLALGATSTFVRDFTGSNFYAITASTVDKITVAAGVITSAWEVAVSPTVVSSDTLTDKAVSYSGTWYSWTLPTIVTEITSSKWLYSSGNNFILAGDFS